MNRKTEYLFNIRNSPGSELRTEDPQNRQAEQFKYLGGVLTEEGY